MFEKTAKALGEACGAAFFSEFFLLTGIERVGVSRDIQGDVGIDFALVVDCAVGLNRRADNHIVIGPQIVEYHLTIGRVNRGFHHRS